MVLCKQCVRDELQGFPILEIPEWMFDRHACGQMEPTEFPHVNCAGGYIPTNCVSHGSTVFAYKSVLGVHDISA